MTVECPRGGINYCNVFNVVSQCWHSGAAAKEGAAADWMAQTKRDFVSHVRTIHIFGELNANVSERKWMKPLRAPSRDIRRRDRPRTTPDYYDRLDLLF
ncbi:unnamed protein product [Leptosia nina]|uniref:Uncharacterized protein n=1 Tax=Leptosia nina TaxID=320188 RepID=A0AAV1IXL7_9NEOP